MFSVEKPDPSEEAGNTNIGKTKALDQRYRCSRKRGLAFTGA
ncbi:MAG: hypothetical protein QXP97_05540 [Desulfurococcus sp.]